MAAQNGEEAGARSVIKSFLGKLSSKPVEIVRKMKELSEEDPRRVVHSFKVALALTIVSLFYYFHPLYHSFGDNAMWAILTVVVVFEFSVGATLGKGLNRMMATLIAGSMGLGAYGIAHHAGKTAEPVLLGLFVFFIAGIVTFLRFFPGMKARYDYGLMIFNLTFCLVSISGYRDTEVVKIAIQRVLTIFLGSLTAMVICLCICPVWSGRELHNSIASNVEKLGDFLEGFAAEYVRTPVGGQPNNHFQSSHTAYRTVLASKSKEETMVNLARWEPCHGEFKFRHPWKQYLKIGTLTRECAYRIESLHSFLDLGNPGTSSARDGVQEPFTHISLESGRVLKELASAIRSMARPSLSYRRITNLKATCDDLRASYLKSSPCSWEDPDLLEISWIIVVSSVLTDIVICIGKISKAVAELALLANFKGASEPVPVKTPSQRYQPVLHRGMVQPFSGDDGGLRDHIVMVGASPLEPNPASGNG